MNLIASLILFISLTTVSYGNKVEDAFKQHEIVPDVIPKAPSQLLKISYASGVEANQGGELTPTQVKDEPTVEWEAEPNTFYTLILTDPDAPSRAEPKFREFNHWIVVNIPGNAVNEGEVISAYIGSGPPKDTGLHRYVFLLYKQSGKLTVDEDRVANNSRKNRPGFKVASFATKYDLGTPIAGNFYQAQYDDYVPILHKQLSEN